MQEIVDATDIRSLNKLGKEEKKTNTKEHPQENTYAEELLAFGEKLTQMSTEKNI